MLAVNSDLIMVTHLDAHHTKDYNTLSDAGVAELADAADLKSAGVILVGSSPTPGIIKAG